jgi:2'-5' RNA ligase
MAAATPSSSSYSLWFAPAQGSSVRAVLEREIATQAAKHSGAPTFEPHVTLLGDLRCCEGGGDAQARSAAEAFARRTRPFRVSFLGVATGATVYQCVFLQCVNEGSLPAANARMREVCAELEIQQGEAAAAGSYTPHLSLLYAPIDAQQRAQAAAEATARLYGPESDYRTLLADDGFDARTVSLWHTPPDDSGSLASWRLVAELPLLGGGE